MFYDSTNFSLINETEKEVFSLLDGIHKDEAVELVKNSLELEEQSISEIITKLERLNLLEKTKIPVKDKHVEFYFHKSKS